MRPARAKETYTTGEGDSIFGTEVIKTHTLNPDDATSWSAKPGQANGRVFIVGSHARSYARKRGLGPSSGVPVRRDRVEPL